MFSGIKSQTSKRALLFKQRNTQGTLQRFAAARNQSLPVFLNQTMEKPRRKIKGKGFPVFSLKKKKLCYFEFSAFFPSDLTSALSVFTDAHTGDRVGIKAAKDPIHILQSLTGGKSGPHHVLNQGLVIRKEDTEPHVRLRSSRTTDPARARACLTLYSTFCLITGRTSGCSGGTEA